MIKEIQGTFNTKNKKYAIIMSRFNELITSKLLEGSIDCLIRHDVLEDNIDIYKVPGAFEIPLLSLKIAKTNKYNAIICLGSVIRGDTTHFEHVSNEVSKGIANASMKTEIPIIFGVLTTENIEQAIERAGTKAGNKGWDAALSAIEMADLLNKI